MTLSAEQQIKAAQCVAEWTRVGLCTEPADRPAAEAAIRLVYECGGLKPPKKIVWCGSPLAMLHAAGDGKTEASSINDHEPHKRGFATGRAVDQLKGEVQSAAQAAGGKPASVYDCIYGQHEAGWLAFYDFMAKEFGQEENVKPLRGLMALARSCGWAAPYENIAYLSERHTTLKRDPQGRLHAVDGPAVAYPDGWSVYAVRGVRVPGEWITDKANLDPRRALTEPNIEQRAAIATILGWDKVMAQLTPRVIDDRTQDMQSLLAMIKDGHHDVGRLVAVDLPDEGEARFLEVVCNAHIDEKRYVRVPPTMRTALEASRWTYRAEGDDVQPEGRT